MKGERLVGLLYLFAALAVLGGIVAMLVLISDRECVSDLSLAQTCTGVTTEVAVSYGIAGVVSGLVLTALGAILQNVIALGRSSDTP